jgi:hypothetical protein
MTQFKDTCSPTRHIFKETNYVWRKGLTAIPCQCGGYTMRLYAYQEITQGEDPVIMQEFEVRNVGSDDDIEVFGDSCDVE